MLLARLRTAPVVVSDHRSYPCKLTAFMGQIIREQPPGFISNHLSQPMVSIGSVLLMRFCQQLCEHFTIFLITILGPFSCDPLVISGSVYVHLTAQFCYWILFLQYVYYLEFKSFVVTNSLSAPTPFTMYPFFRRSFSI